MCVTENLIAEKADPCATKSYSESTIVNLFNAHANSINVEKQLIWQRYQAMLVANSIGFGFITGNLSAPPRAMLGCAFGLLLCLFWLRVTKFGWNHMWDRINRAQRFTWVGLDNPFDGPYQQDVKVGKVKDYIYETANSIIYLFMVSYIFMALWSFLRLNYPVVFG